MPVGSHKCVCTSLSNHDACMCDGTPGAGQGGGLYLRPQPHRDRDLPPSYVSSLVSSLRRGGCYLILTSRSASFISCLASASDFLNFGVLKGKV